VDNRTPQPLAEPCLNLSAYRAPIVQRSGFRPNASERTARDGPELVLGHALLVLGQALLVVVERGHGVPAGRGEQRLARWDNSSKAFPICQ
jgi:hypothetical protein